MTRPYLDLSRPNTNEVMVKFDIIRRGFQYIINVHINKCKHYCGQNVLN